MIVNEHHINITLNRPRLQRGLVREAILSLFV